MSFLKDNLTDAEKDKLEEVRDFVAKERRRMDVPNQQIGTTHRLEGSCFARGQKTGEFKNLLYRQLVYTKYPYGDWVGLNGKVLDGLLKYIQRIKSFRDDKEQ